jgi:LysR family transcriptional regulator, cyn operon transcriptional activator
VLNDRFYTEDPHLREGFGPEGSRMELRHLRYFSALAAELSFTRAAEKVHVTQSTLSHQIKQLEAEIGQPLFSRIGKRVVITEAGEMLLSRVSRALREIDDGIRALKGSTEPLQGKLQIGSTYTFNIKFVPLCVGEFLRRHCNVSVTVLELSATDVEEQLDQEIIDLGIAYRPAQRPGFLFEPLYTDEMVLAVGKGHPFSTRKRIRLAELHHHALVLQTKDSDTRQILDSNFKSVGAEPVIVAEMNAAGPMISLVQQSNLAAIVSKHVASEFEKVSFISLESPTPIRTAGILLKKSRQKTLACQSFISVIRQTIINSNMLLSRIGTPIQFPLAPDREFVELG